MGNLFWRALTLALYALAMWGVYTAVSWFFNSTPLWVSGVFLAGFFIFAIGYGIARLLDRS